MARVTQPREITMASNKYLLIYRNAATTNQPPPSPEALQQMLATWDAWKSKFKAKILDMGDGLKPSGKVLSASKLTDGPFIEGKDVVGGFSIVQADNYDEAVTIARGCPIMQVPGGHIEVREMMGF